MRRLLSRLRFYGGFHLLAVSVAQLDERRPLHRKHSHLRYAAATAAELLAWCKDPELDLDEEKVTAALARGDLCIAVREQETPIGYVWFAFGAAPHVHGAWVRTDASARYLYKAFIRPSHRGRGIAAELYSRASQICPRRGRTLGVLTAYADNARGLKAARRAGWREVGYAGFMELPGGLLPFRTRGARDYGFAFYEKS